MTDDEEILDYLELFHFSVRIIGEDLNFLDIFKTGLAKILRSRVERFICELPSENRNGLNQDAPQFNESSFIHSQSYTILQLLVTSQMRSIIDSIRRAKLWIPQGTGNQRADPASTISSIIQLSPEKIGIDELHILRSVPTEKMTFSPDLTLYYISLFHATLAPEQFTRSFAYSLIRLAPQLLDPRHFFNVLKEAVKFWKCTPSSTNFHPITFEFAASLALLLNQLPEMIHSCLDDTIEEVLFELVETIPKSTNFSLLIYFDPTFKWLVNVLPIETIKNILESSFELLSGGSYAHLCLILRSILRGIIGSESLIPALESSLSSASTWPKAMMREARVLLTALVTRINQETINSILDLLATQLHLPDEDNSIDDKNSTKSDENSDDIDKKSSEDRIRITVTVFSDFIINYMLNTTAPFHESLFDSVQHLVINEQKNKANHPIFISIPLTPTPAKNNTTLNPPNSRNSNRSNMNVNRVMQNIRITSPYSINQKVISDLKSPPTENDNTDLVSSDSEALLKVFASLCSNPVRFLQSVEKAPDRSIFDLPFIASQTTLYHVLFQPEETALMLGDCTSKSGQCFCRFAEAIDEIDPIEFSVAQIECCLRFGLWPSLYRNFLINQVLIPASQETGSNISTTNYPIETWHVSEDTKYYIIQIIYVISLRGSQPELIQNDFSEFFSSFLESESTENTPPSIIQYECEYSEMIRQICNQMKQRPTPFEILKEKVEPSTFEIFVIGSKTLVALSLLFEYAIWNEPDSLFICFKRSRVCSTEWFAFVASSLFVTMFDEVVEVIEPTVVKYGNQSILYYVWFAVVLVKKIHNYWMDLVADENFPELLHLMLFPKISEGFTDDDIQYAIGLHQKYQDVFTRFTNVINCE